MSPANHGQMRVTSAFRRALNHCKYTKLAFHPKTNFFFLLPHTRMGWHQIHFPRKLELMSSKFSKENCQVDYWFIGICLVKTSVLIRDSEFLIFRLFQERYSNMGQRHFNFYCDLFMQKEWNHRGGVMEACFPRFSLPTFLQLPPAPLSPSPSKPRPFSVLFGEELIRWFRLGC